MKFKYILSIVAILPTFNLMAQSMEEEHHHKNDLGFSDELVYLFEPQEFANGICVHYIRNIRESDFGIGVGYDHVFGDLTHNTFGIVGRYIPIDDWIINVSPGVTFEGGESSFTAHLETSYVFDVSVFHIGPVISYATNFEEAHMGVGIHFGYGF